MEDETHQSMYIFEGHDYSKETRDISAADKDAFQTLLECEWLALLFLHAFFSFSFFLSFFFFINFINTLWTTK